VPQSQLWNKYNGVYYPHNNPYLLPFVKAELVDLRKKFTCKSFIFVIGNE